MNAYHIQHMQRALELAKLGAGRTSPNPLVGAVIVKEGRVIGEGYHAMYGGPHAEVNAIENASESVEGAEIYVTLEPCSHYGKTPPCALKLIENRFSKVYIAMEDPNPLVAGRGIQMLRKQGIEVEVGLLEEEAKALNEVFIKYITTKKPFCVMKAAMTLDGKIATVTGESQWITSEAAREYVHQLRHELKAIMVGIGTVLKDDPKLTTRLKGKQGRDPIRVVVDSTLKIPLNAKILHLDSDAPTLIATTDRADSEKATALQSMPGVKLIITPQKDGKVDLDYLMFVLGEQGIDSLLLEGGATLNASALESKIVDKVLMFIAPKILGGQNAPTPVGGSGIEVLENAVRLKGMKAVEIGDDLLIEARI
ncbi:bifunctional diaminohydroxyphosphoribosylaminopyrimidine deaminase/5-amino-6-(5-phosphoribosylamino)uracil reductase RibD [Acidaminobacter sp.]|uniref:bifunctional diaminohydroxyphosphoribosylaminopyrimidine deaminase/5-amino-6-(5-phosphoribosylamino)uracil reductase RibD n=1 Tax=Acidaminobacter sp. TaxID=1872102 RepID=UPI002568FA21|nr:bifunctional diaminohydroxyphosphoribosylaminopyrimidine deaminase/5-amino-6-(5-phosphoribosylamino)uracil reductase RibD [Acidaminobacter sp.]MDK9709878.1 bifunctional diaminohydroxyphosphoribosylaminopyrimidine deaminase/5-amino-6-(5-phosphoribosylamino)uracil reductase RibD [Acidaminobacter sp.]